MYICICKNITDNDIRRSFESGDKNFRKIRKSLGVATECGQCACEAKQLINDMLEEHHALENTPLFSPA
ncbi:MAG: (2Fe-2S)-binding protein [Cellvibrionales bacterium]|nr:(2Fe-2S)-binding protein [Cellvibrionales bacterium]